MKKIIINLIKFYQKYLSILSYGSCRYYPTCSEYAIMQFKFNNIFKALFFSTKRILTCNPFFKGGFDYPSTKCPLSNKSFKKITVKYWLVPKGDKCYILKIKKFKGK